MWKFAFLICFILANLEMAKAPAVSGVLMSPAAGISHLGGRTHPQIGASGRAKFLPMAKMNGNDKKLNLIKSLFEGDVGNDNGIPHHSNIGAHPLQNDGKHPSEPLQQNKPKNGLKNSIKNLAEMPLNALFKILRPIEFIVEVAIMAPIILDSLQKTNNNGFKKQRDELKKKNKKPERDYFIETIEKLMNLANSADNELEKNVEKNLKNLQNIGHNSKELAKTIVAVLNGKPNIQIPSHFNPTEGLLVKSLIKGKELEKELKNALGNVVKDVDKLAIQGATAMLAIILAPIEIGANAYVVFSLMYSRHKQQERANSYYYGKPSFKVQMKMRIIYAMAMFEDWLGEIGKNTSIKMKEFQTKIMKIFGGNQIEIENKFGALERQFEQIVKKKMGEKNAKDLDGILKTLKNHPQKNNEIKLTELDRGESDLEFDLEENTLADHNPLNLNGLGHPNINGNGHHHSRRKRDINKHNYAVVGFILEEEIEQNKAIHVNVFASSNSSAGNIKNVMDEEIKSIV